MNTKHCKKCGQELPVSKFWKNKRSHDGLSYICIDCYNERYYSKTKNTLYHKAARLKKRKHYSEWGGLILRDKTCKQCSKYRRSCPINFDIIKTDFGQTCKSFSP